MSKRGYHHGNLRQALVDAALTLIAEKGPTGFTMAEAAKIADVSAAAPYRHFKGRDELLQEVARQGFEEIHPETLSPADVARLMSEASHVVAGAIGLGVAR